MNLSLSFKGGVDNIEAFRLFRQLYALICLRPELVVETYNLIAKRLKVLFNEKAHLTPGRQ